MDLDKTLLQQGLVWLISGGGAGAVAYWLLEKVDWSSELERYLSVALSAGLAAVAYLFFIWMGYNGVPENTKDWIETLSAVMFLSYMTSQIVHGRKKLRNNG